jgi:hypothetical protein
MLLLKLIEILSNIRGRSWHIRSLRFRFICISKSNTQWTNKTNHFYSNKKKLIKTIYNKNVIEQLQKIAGNEKLKTAKRSEIT